MIAIFIINFVYKRKRASKNALVCTNYFSFLAKLISSFISSKVISELPFSSDCVLILSIAEIPLRVLSDNLTSNGSPPT